MMAHPEKMMPYTRKMMPHTVQMIPCTRAMILRTNEMMPRTDEMTPYNSRVMPRTGLIGIIPNRFKPASSVRYSLFEQPESLQNSLLRLFLSSVEKKYTVFVSSTQSDLHAEREQVTKAILELGHIPIGMEMFSAADEQQWQLIQRQIQQSDYYLVIVAHRYGSMAGNVSYTEREYDYAAEIGVPRLGFVIDDDAKWPVDQIDKDGDVLARLNAFKDKVKSKIVSFWGNAEQLNTKVAVALSKQFASNPRPGWVRADTVPGSEVLGELSRLSKENAELRSQIDTKVNPKFEIMYADIVQLPKYTVTNLIVLVTYVGPPIYLPAHRVSVSLECSGITFALLPLETEGSDLIVIAGNDLQINGSGHFRIQSYSKIPVELTSDSAKLELSVRFVSEVASLYSVNLSAPHWKFGEAGLDLEEFHP